MNTEPNFLPHLLAGLSDGTLKAHELRQLGERLKSDPGALDQYLAHAYIDALLEYEFCGTNHHLTGNSLGNIRTVAEEAAVRTKDGCQPWARRSPRWVWGLAAMILITFAASFAGRVRNWRPDPKPFPFVGLTNGSFEEDLRGDGGTRKDWYGDVADLVEGDRGILPADGSRMLRFLKVKTDSDRTSEVLQLIDVRSSSGGGLPGTLVAEASAAFNAQALGPPEDLGVFGIQLFAYGVELDPQAGDWYPRDEGWQTYNVTQIPADADERSWQHVSTKLVLPEGTKYLVLRLCVVPSDPRRFIHDEHDHFLDDVRLRLVASSGDLL